jgi:hypothetical protein
MKRIFTIIAFACITLFAFSQNIPAGMRMELTEVEENNNEYSIFTYKDQDGTFGYYMSLGHVYHLLEIIRDDVTDMSLDHIEETCLWLGANPEEALATIEALLEMLDKPEGTTAEYPCRISTGAGRLGDSSTAFCFVVKRLLQGKRLCFHFQVRNHTAEADLTKSAIKSLRWNFNLYQKMHPNG